MKRLNINIVALLLTIMVVTRERNYYVEAEHGFHRYEYAKASNLYTIAHAMICRDTSAKQKLSDECVEAQRNAHKQKNDGNSERAKDYYEKQ